MSFQSPVKFRVECRDACMSQCSYSDLNPCFKTNRIAPRIDTWECEPFVIQTHLASMESTSHECPHSKHGTLNLHIKSLSVQLHLIILLEWRLQQFFSRTLNIWMDLHLTHWMDRQPSFAKSDEHSSELAWHIGDHITQSAFFLEKKMRFWWDPAARPDHHRIRADPFGCLHGLLAASKADEMILLG